MTEAQEAAAQQRSERAARRRDAAEAEERAEVRSVWEHIPDEKQRIFAAIEKLIDRLDIPEEVAYLQETRAIHFRPYRRFLQKGDS